MIELPLNFPHKIEKSSTEGHTHIYLDVPLKKIEWLGLLCALRFAQIVELGYFVWSIRRGGNFVRTNDTPKSDDEQVKPEYGWFFKIRKQDA